jgi:hypothetical protein
MLQLINAGEFIRLDTKEHLDFAASKGVLQSLAYSCRKRGVGSALLDLRALPVLEKPWFTSAEIAGLVQTFRDAGFSKNHSLAVLYRQDPHRGIRNFAFISRMKGLQVQAFTEFEEAFQWLSAEPKVRDEKGDTVPIFKGTGSARKWPTGLIVVKKTHTGGNHRIRHPH